MLFPQDALFGFVLVDLEEEISRYPAPAARPLPCDRYLARSALQKAIRRGDVSIAQRALATLVGEDKSGVWRHLIVIALEDIGVANVDVLARIVAARSDRKWRNRAGGDWRVLAELVRQMAESGHCQAVCDLLLQATNSPHWEATRLNALQSGAAALAREFAQLDLTLEHRAIALLAVGGGLTDQQWGLDPTRAFCLLGRAGYASHVLAVCQAAWRTARNPMAFLLPLLWKEWMAKEGYLVEDDEFAEVTFIQGMPAYAIDQFTRSGSATARAYASSSREMRELMDGLRIPAARRGRAVGDLIFLTEGSALARRVIWPLGDQLRLPVRLLATVRLWGDHLYQAIEVLRSQSDLLADLRKQHLQFAS